MAGTLYVVATPIGNLEDISARALRVLSEVALIAAEDTRRTGQLLQRFGLTTPSTSFHEHNAKSKAPALVARLVAGENIALVSDAGTPGVSDPGQELVRLAREAGVAVSPIPGPSAVTAALSICGFEGDGFVFLGFPPSSGSARDRWFERFRLARQVVPLVVFYEAPHRIARTLADVASAVGSAKVLLCRELTKIHEQVEVGLITDLSPVMERGEFVCVVDVGHMTASNDHPSLPDAPAIYVEFCDLTKASMLSRRQAIASLTRKYRASAREIYALVEQGKVESV